MVEYYNIAMIGAGNVAWHLAPALENAGHKVVDIYSRNRHNAVALQKRLYNAEINKSLDFSGSEADVVFLCIPDEAIAEVAGKTVLPGGAAIVHTSGSIPINVLGYSATGNAGVFYPLQTFTKGKRIDFSDVPILIEGESKPTTKILKSLARSISRDVREVSTADRLAVHVAAVFACNFTNYMLTIAEEILRDKRFDIELLRPLVAETLNKSLDIGPENAQTGPAARGDLETLERHLEFLAYSGHEELYKLISEKILNR